MPPASPRNVISIQSSVAFGHVGNSAAIFPLQRLGIDAWPVTTVLLSNHPGHGACRGRGQTPAEIQEILLGMEERGIFARTDALLTGYLSDPAVGPLTLETLAKIRAGNRPCIFACDPVMGDNGGFFVADGLPQFFKHKALPLADLITPNVFELGYLSEMTVSDLAQVLAAARKLLEIGPSTVLVTSLETPEQPNEIGMLLVRDKESFAVFTPKLDIKLNGTGDCLSALALAHSLAGRSAKEIVERVAATMFALVERTYRAGSKELQLIAAQDAIVDPDCRFQAVEL